MSTIVATVQPVAPSWAPPVRGVDGAPVLILCDAPRHGLMILRV
jgi:hypothetical protein